MKRILGVLACAVTCVLCLWSPLATGALERVFPAFEESHELLWYDPPSTY